MPKISSIHIYPIKSMGGIELKSAKTTDRGLQGDRRWMLVDETGRFISQREQACLATFACRANEGGFTVYKGSDSLELPWSVESGKLLPTKVWSDSLPCYMPSNQWNKWFSEKLQTNVRLVYMPAEAKRTLDQRFSKGLNSLSDGYPILLVNESSLDDLNERLGSKIEMSRFRPNVVIQQLANFREDEISCLNGKGYSIRLVKPCSRCVVINTDQKSGERTKEPLATLATFRKFEGKVNFGQNAVIDPGAILTVGDELKAL